MKRDGSHYTVRQASRDSEYSRDFLMLQGFIIWEIGVKRLDLRGFQRLLGVVSEWMVDLIMHAARSSCGRYINGDMFSAALVDLFE